MRKLPLPLKIFRRFVLCVVELLWIPFYHLIGLFPRDKNYWIFVSWFGTRYSDNTRIFFEWVNKNHPEIRTVWLSKSADVVRDVRRRGFCAFKNNSLKGVVARIRAGRLFSSTGGEISYRLTKGIEHYALWHGMPLKKIGLDDDVGFFASRRNKRFEFIYYKVQKCLYPWQGAFFSDKGIMTITNAEFFRHNLSTAFGIREDRILPTGSPRCDALFHAHPEELIERIHGQFPGNKIILYMPTFRTAEWTGEVFNPFDEKYGFDMDEFLAELERHKSVLVYKPHFSDARFMQSVRQKEGASRLVTVSDDDYDELYNFLGQVDMLMTDYSSVYFDFIATGKPVLLAPFDYDEYLRTARAHYFDYWNNMEGVKIRNWGEFEEALESCAPVSEDTRRNFAEYLDGNCCEKLWERIG